MDLAVKHTPILQHSEFSPNENTEDYYEIILLLCCFAGEYRKPLTPPPPVCDTPAAVIFCELFFRRARKKEVDRWSDTLNTIIMCPNLHTSAQHTGILRVRSQVRTHLIGLGFSKQWARRRVVIDII